MCLRRQGSRLRTKRLTKAQMRAVACCTLWSSAWHPGEGKELLFLPDSLLNGQQFRVGVFNLGAIEAYHKTNISYLTPDITAALAYSGYDGTASEKKCATIVQFEVTAKTPIVVNVGERSVVADALIYLISNKTYTKKVRDAMKKNIWATYGVRLGPTQKEIAAYDKASYHEQREAVEERGFKDFADNEKECLAAAERGECVRASIASIDADVHKFFLNYAEHKYGKGRKTALIGSGTLVSFLEPEYPYHHSEIIAPANCGVIPSKAIAVSDLLPRAVGAEDYLNNLTHPDTRASLEAARPPPYNMSQVMSALKL